MTHSYLSRNHVLLIGIVIVTLAVLSVIIIDHKCQPGSFLSPAQDQYRQDEDIRAAITYLSNRWNVPSDSLYVLALRSVDPYKELGIVDVVTYSSARIIISSSSVDEAIDNSGNVYLFNEFQPQGSQSAIACALYSTKTPSLDSKEDYATIVWWKVGAADNGEITALTKSGYITIPVVLGMPLKDLSYYGN